MFTELNNNISDKVIEAKIKVSKAILEENRLKILISELDQECTIVYQATQINEFKRLNKIYNRLREYKLIMDHNTLVTVKKLIEDLAIGYYIVVRPELIKVEEKGN